MRRRLTRLWDTRLPGAPLLAAAGPSLTSTSLVSRCVQCSARQSCPRASPFCPCCPPLQKLSDDALVALARAAGASLRSLDVSRCRGITDAGLGELIDAAPALGRLVLWGDSQLTGGLFHGHRRAEAAVASESLSQEAGGWGVPLRVFGRPGDALPVDDA